MNPTTTQTNSTVQNTPGNIAYTQGDINQIDTQLNNQQQQTLQELENRDPEVVKTENRIGAEIDLEVGEFAPPEIPDFSEMYIEMRRKYGLDELDKALNELKGDYRSVEALSRERRNVAMNQQVSMDVIGGRTGEIERQANEQLDTIGRQISYMTDLHNSALSVVNMVMQFEQVDYQNAFESYKTSFDARMAQYTLKKDLAGQEADRAFREKQFMHEAAMANLTILADMAANGNWNYNNLSAEQRAAVGKMEVQAGLPVGFLSNIQVDPAKRILNTSEWTDMNGNTYLLVSKIGADGNITIDKQLIGKSSSGGGRGGGSSGGTAGERQSTKDANFVKQASIKGNNPERQATILAVQRFDVDSTGKKTVITEENIYKAVSYLASSQGISDEAAFNAVQEIIRSHHYTIGSGGGTKISGSGANSSVRRTA